ncbi:MAG TPA: phenylalanine--tRNA ligase beta subunit-related protein [Thermomicrobiales bacterium]|nr:phenylalanine--tRNA ligase beta subunit-related protein [Thermomicrobiales bacterium]
MYFEHSRDIWRQFPELVVGVIQTAGISADADVDAPIAELTEIARGRLGNGSESLLPEVQAWRRVFSRMGLKPTQYRCASESLLRRFRKEGELPRIHPLIDLCNAASLVFATPVAAFDVAAVAGYIEVRHATGDERYLSFTGEIEHPDPGEVIFADAAGQVHARRWTHRQSGLSAIRPTTSDVLIVAEAMHDSAATDVPALIDALAGRITTAWSVEPRTAILSADDPRFIF